MSKDREYEFWKKVCKRHLNYVSSTVNHKLHPRVSRKTDTCIYPSSYATRFLHLPKAHLHTPLHSPLMPPFMHPSLPPTPNNLLSPSRMYSDPHLVVLHQIPAHLGRRIPTGTKCCLFCIERIPALLGQSSVESSCPPGTGQVYACRGEVRAHLEGPPAPLDVPRCSP